MVFVGGAGSGGTVYGVDGATGHVRWTGQVENGDNSSPALSANGVYVSYACVQAYEFAPLTGALLWHHSGPCEGGGGDTAVLYQGSLWARDTPEGNLVLDANTGNTIAAFSASAIPAFAGTRGFFVVGGALQALDTSTRDVLWTFSPGALVSAPLVVNDRVYVGLRRAVHQSATSTNARNSARLVGTIRRARQTDGCKSANDELRH